MRSTSGLGSTSSALSLLIVLGLSACGDDAVESTTEGSGEPATTGGTTAGVTSETGATSTGGETDGTTEGETETGGELCLAEPPPEVTAP